MSQEVAGDITLSAERVQRRKKEFFLEGSLLSADGERHDFFGHLGPGFFILNVPFTPEGERLAALVVSRLGSASRGPETKCGGGCSGDGMGSGLVTVFSWEFPAGEGAVMRQMLSRLFGDVFSDSDSTRVPGES